MNFCLKKRMYKYISEDGGTERRKQTYIKCKGCKCKYINDEEHIKQDFGYNRLGEQLKPCEKCRKNKKDKENTKQQIIDNNVDKLCNRCCQVKSKTEFGEYELRGYDKELKKTQMVMTPYKSCARCRKYREDNADKQRSYSTMHKNKKLQQ